MSDNEQMREAFEKKFDGWDHERDRLGVYKCHDLGRLWIGWVFGYKAALQPHPQVTGGPDKLEILSNLLRKSSETAENAADLNKQPSGRSDVVEAGNLAAREYLKDLVDVLKIVEAAKNEGKLSALKEYWQAAIAAMGQPSAQLSEDEAVKIMAGAMRYAAQSPWEWENIAGSAYRSLLAAMKQGA